MSSYLNIYARYKDKDLLLVSFPGCSDVYQTLYDLLPSSSRCELSIPLGDMAMNLDCAKEKLTCYKELAGMNTEYMSDYLEFCDYVRNKEKVYNQLQMLAEIASDDYTDFSAILYEYV